MGGARVLARAEREILYLYDGRDADIRRRYRGAHRHAEQRRERDGGRVPRHARGADPVPDMNATDRTNCGKGEMVVLCRTSRSETLTMSWRPNPGAKIRCHSVVFLHTGFPRIVAEYKEVIVRSFFVRLAQIVASIVSISLGIYCGVYSSGW